MKNFKTVVIKAQKAENQRPEPQTEMNQIQDSSQGYENVQDTAEYLAFKPSTIYTLVERKEIPFYKVGRLIRFRRVEIDEWMQTHKEPVVDAKMEARKVISSLQRRPNLDVDRIVKKAIDEAEKRGYTSHYGKPDKNRGLRKEVEDGTL
jgi:excisionase family DNA binding protein